MIDNSFTWTAEQLSGLALTKDMMILYACGCDPGSDPGFDPGSDPDPDLGAETGYGKCVEFDNFRLPFSKLTLSGPLNGLELSCPFLTRCGISVPIASARNPEMEFHPSPVLLAPNCADLGPTSTDNLLSFELASLSDPEFSPGHQLWDVRFVSWKVSMSREEDLRICWCGQDRRGCRRASDYMYDIGKVFITGMYYCR